MWSKLVPQGSLKRSREIGKAHYDTGNDLFSRMLDPWMQYSCGYWQSGANDLDAAQVAKLDLVCRKLELKPGMTLLDVGCGWGGLSKFAAERYGVSVVGITVSEEQADHARAWCEGLPVEIRVQDYRLVQDRFDRIVSVGMFEHVGRRFYPAYFDMLRRCLNDDGLALVHTIGINSSGFTYPWLTRYIFPGGYLPSLGEIFSATDGRMALEDLHSIGPNYEPTLLAWHDRALAARPALDPLKYDERFWRMWRFYLLSVAPSFSTRVSQVWQFVFSKDGVEGGYEPKR